MLNLIKNNWEQLNPKLLKNLSLCLKCATVWVKRLITQLLRKDYEHCGMDWGTNVKIATESSVEEA